MNKNLREISQKIAAELGCTVHPGGNEYLQKIAGAEVPFIIYSVWSTGKLEIALNYPATADGKKVTGRDLYPVAADTSIKVNDRRSSVAIAADIKRRFFPAAKEVYAACVERAKQDDNYGTTCANGAAAIEKIFPGASKRQESPNTHASVNFSTGGLSGRAEVLRESVNLTLSGSTADMIDALLRLSKPQ